MTTFRTGDHVWATDFAGHLREGHVCSYSTLNDEYSVHLSDSDTHEVFQSKQLRLIEDFEIMGARNE